MTETATPPESPHVTLVNRFAVHGEPQEFESAFARASEFLTAMPGFLDHTLHQSDADPTSYVNIARWADVESLLAATRHPDFQPHVEVLRGLATTSPGVYRRVLHRSRPQV